MPRSTDADNTDTRDTRKGLELAQQVLALDTFRRKKKTVMAEWKAQEELLLQEISRLAFELRTGQKDLYDEENE